MWDDPTKAAHLLMTPESYKINAFTDGGVANPCCHKWNQAGFGMWLKKGDDEGDNADEDQHQFAHKEDWKDAPAARKDLAAARDKFPLV